MLGRLPPQQAGVAHDVLTGRRQPRLPSHGPCWWCARLRRTPCMRACTRVGVLGGVGRLAHQRVHLRLGLDEHIRGIRDDHWQQQPNG
jgi:hypothetical protein